MNVDKDLPDDLTYRLLHIPNKLKYNSFRPLERISCMKPDNIVALAS
uniref:Uncharacterized protein n=1 Tax=Arundo donax TaxID=35708 RepID=A0A0A9C1I6_ARUDO